ncbi:hypothetical protein K1719_040448 [Acacia pycnantha]|nr:hypothetical protein K1719_040448 [Acacia pycnantha]
MDSIMKNLPIQDAVKTSILSRNWRYMWNSVPRLEFNATFFGERLKKHEISNAISEVLLQHHGPIHEFILFVPDVYPIRIKCLSMWILFLSRRNMKILKLINQQGDQYEMPSHLFSCKDLIRLELSNFTLRSPPDFVIGFKSLVQLHMSYVRIDSATLNALISSCPLLGDGQPNLSRCLWWFDGHGYSLPQLRTVTIEVYIIFEMALNLVECLLAVSPSLETLTFKIHQEEQPDPIKLLEVSRTLLQMRRASPKAELSGIARSQRQMIHQLDNLNNLLQGSCKRTMTSAAETESSSGVIVMMTYDCGYWGFGDLLQEGFNLFNRN